MTDKEQKRIFSINLTSYLGNKSQKEVAKAIGVSPQTFNTWCQGIALPRMGKLQLLADYFGIEKSDLIDDKTNKADFLTVSLNPSEQELLNAFHKLNSLGKNRAQEYISDLTEQTKYTSDEAAAEKKEA